jgi:hypothetical protein
MYILLIGSPHQFVNFETRRDAHQSHDRGDNVIAAVDNFWTVSELMSFFPSFNNPNHYDTHHYDTHQPEAGHCNIPL